MDLPRLTRQGQVAIVLGGTNPHRVLVENLNSRGYQTVVVDPNPSPAAAQVADVHIRANAWDPKVVLHIAEQYKASLVISVCLDRTIPVVAEVSAQLGLPSVYTPTNAPWFTDKSVMKQIFKTHGIRVPNDQVVEHFDELELHKLGFPMVLKPSDSTGSLGIEVVRTPEELKPAFDRTLSASTAKTVIAEEWLAGREFSIDCVVSAGICRIVLVRERLNKVTSDGGTQCYTSLAPASISEPEMRAIEEVARAIPKAFQLINAPLLIQGFLDGPKGFKVIEIAVRLGGGPGSFRVATLSAGVDLIDTAVDCNLGKACDIQLHDSGLVYATINLYAKGGVLDRVEGVEELLRSGVVQEYYTYKAVGSEFSSDTTSRNRFAAVVISAPTHKELHRKVEALYDGLKIFDRSGSDLFDMDLAYRPTENP